MELTREYFDQQLTGLATKADFDNLQAFIQSNLALKDDLQELKVELFSKEDFSQLLTSVNELAQLTKDYYEAVTVLRGKVERMEKWIQDAAPMLVLKYEV